MTYKLTGDLRTQAEKRLSVEDSISAAINKQILGLREAHSEYEKFKRSLQQDEDFSSRLTSAVNTSDASAIKREQERIDAENSKRIDKIGLLQSDLAQKERSLEFAKNRNVNQGFFATLGAPDYVTQGLFTTLGIGRGYTASQKQQDVSQAESAVEKTKKALAENENELRKGEANFQRTSNALDDITTRQNEAFNQRNEIFKRTQENGRRFAEELKKREEEKLKTENAKRVAEFKKSVEAIEDLTVKLNQENPFVSLAVEGESAIRKLKDTITDPSLLQSALKLQQAINLKQYEKLSYQSESRALTGEQNAIKTSRIRDNELGGFQRALETVDKKIDFAVKMFELNKKIDESDFYARIYNPNNPKSFDESRFSFAQRDRFAESAGDRRRGESMQDYKRRRQEAILSGIRVNDAFGEINKLRNFSTDGTGIFGEGIIADKILERLPSQEDLFKLLSSPYIGEREKAQSLLPEQSNALRNKRDLETRKLQDFLYDQQTRGLNQKFAGEQLNLLNEQKSLSPLDRAKGVVDILNPLGNDISPQQRRELYENQLAVAKYERRQKEEAQGYLRNINEKLNAVISANGLKVAGTVALDADSKQAMSDGSLEIILNDLTANGATVKQTGRSLTAQDTADYYGQ